MPTRKQIKEFYQKLHNDITVKFYREHSLTREQFDAQHKQCWEDYRNEMFVNGFMKKEYVYTFGKVLDTPIGLVGVEVTVTSPQELTTQQINGNRDLLNQGEWEHRNTEERLVEI